MMQAVTGENEESPVADFFALEPRIFRDMAEALVNLKRCIDYYFLGLHPMMFMSDRGECLRSLEKVVLRLAGGDAVITTNWDALPERALHQQRLWSPISGYGIDIALDSRTPPWMQKPIISKDSAVKVLKLHGSVGWMKRMESDAEWFLRRDFLQWFAPGFRDAREIPADPPSQVMIYPTLLKQFDQDPFRQIWQLATDTLLNADRICVIGYSLPAGDVAVGALIHAIRSRLDNGQIAFTVVDPSEKTLQRWRRLMGPNARLVPMKLAEYSMNGELLDATL